MREGVDEFYTEQSGSQQPAQGGDFSTMSNDDLLRALGQ
jgi:hypothetical protein